MDVEPMKRHISNVSLLFMCKSSVLIRVTTSYYPENNDSEYLKLKWSNISVPVAGLSVVLEVEVAMVVVLSCTVLGKLKSKFDEKGFIHIYRCIIILAVLMVCINQLVNHLGILYE